MESCQLDDFTITPDKEGAREFSKVSYPIRYGHFSEIKTPDSILQFKGSHLSLSAQRHERYKRGKQERDFEKIQGGKSPQPSSYLYLPHPAAVASPP